MRKTLSLVFYLLFICCGMIHASNEIELHADSGKTDLYIILVTNDEGTIKYWNTSTTAWDSAPTSRDIIDIPVTVESSYEPGVYYSSVPSGIVTNGIIFRVSMYEQVGASPSAANDNELWHETYYWNSGILSSPDSAMAVSMNMELMTLLWTPMFTTISNTDTNVSTIVSDGVNLLSISGDTSAADNLEATFDGTGYVDDQAPATQQALRTSNQTINSIYGNLNSVISKIEVVDENIGNIEISVDDIAVDVDDLVNITNETNTNVNTINTNVNTIDGIVDEILVDVNNLPDESEITDAVWDEPITQHTTEGSTGNALYNIDAESIATAVVDAIGTSGVVLSPDGLDNIDLTEPIGLADTFPEMVMQLWQYFFYELQITSSSIKTYRSDGELNTIQVVTYDSIVKTQEKAEGVR